MYYVIYRNNVNAFQKGLVRKTLDACNAEYELVRADNITRDMIIDVVKASSEGFEEVLAMQTKTLPATKKLNKYILERATFNEAIDIILRNPLIIKSLIIYDDKRKKIITRFLDGWERQIVGDMQYERAKKFKKEAIRNSYYASALEVIGLWSEEEEEYTDAGKKRRNKINGNKTTSKIHQGDDLLY